MVNSINEGQAGSKPAAAGRQIGAWPGRPLVREGPASAHRHMVVREKRSKKIDTQKVSSRGSVILNPKMAENDLLRKTPHNEVFS